MSTDARNTENREESKKNESVLHSAWTSAPERILRRKSVVKVVHVTPLEAPGVHHAPLETLKNLPPVRPSTLDDARGGETPNRLDTTKGST